MKRIIFGILILLLISCFENRNSSNRYYEEDEVQEEYSYRGYESSNEESEGYEDGTYEAEVHYYNPNTGTSATYTLDVEIEDNELIKIYWNNGGWLDDDHFSPVDISSGSASFTSDKGYKYEVDLLE